MKKYAKFINEGKIEYAPKNKGNIINYNLPANKGMLRRDGYLPVEESACPEDGGKYLAGYEKTTNAIATVWKLQIPTEKENALEEEAVPEIIGQS